MLRWLGAPVLGKTFLFGNTKSIMESGSLPHSRLKKRHDALSYHIVQEAVVAGLVQFSHIPGNCDPADVLSKHGGCWNGWLMTKPLLFHEGDTSQIREEDDRKIDQKLASKTKT